MKLAHDFRVLSVAALAGVTTLGIANGVQAAETTTIAAPLPDGTEKSITFQTTFGQGDASVTQNFTVLGQDVSYTYKFDNLYGDENGDTSITKEATVLSSPVTFTYKYDSTVLQNERLENTTDISSNPLAGNFVGQESQSTPFYNGGAIENDGTIGNINSNFIENKAYYYGGAIYNSGDIGDITGDFVGNSTKGYSSDTGGAIYNDSDSTIGNINGSFIGNKALNAGGAIYNNGTILDITGDFIANNGRALENYNKIDNITGDFISNSLGGLYSGRSGNIISVNSNFISNSTEYSGSGLNNGGTIGSVTGVFAKNYSRIYGGALYNTGEITNIKALFIDNSVADKKYPHGSGGAIQNGASGYSGHIGMLEADFVNNRIDVSKDAQGTHNNILYAQGGAIFNENKSSIDKIKGNFLNNSVYSDGYADGGAIHNSMQSEIGEIEGLFVSNHSIVADDSEHYAQGGAIQNLASSKINKITGDFIGNYAKGSSTASGGAIMNSKHAEIDYIKASFVDNYVAASVGGRYSQGGAIYNSSGAVMKTIEGDFSNNRAFNSTTAGGGAIYNNGAKFEKIEGNFTDNYASAENYAGGGAIYNYYGVMDEIDGSFINNYAKAENGTAKGGAIFSLGSTTLVAKDGKTNVIRGNYVEDRNGVRNEGIYVATEMKKNNNIIARASGSGYGFYNKFSDYVESDIPTPIEGKLDIVAKDNGTFVIDDPINGDSTTGMIDYDITTYYANWNSTQRVYVDTNDNFLAHYKATVTSEDVVVGTDDTGADITAKKEITTIEYRLTSDGTGDVVAKEIIEKIEGSDKVTTTYYDANGNEVDELPIRITENVSSELSYNVNFKGDETGSIYLNNNILNGANITLQGTNLYLSNRDNVLNGNNLVLDSGTLSMLNNQVGVSALNSLTVAGDTDFVADVDLKNQTMDRFTANAYGAHQGKLNVIGMNLLSDAPEDRDKTEIYFAEKGLKDSVENGMSAELPDSNYQTTLYTPIYKYNVSYENRDDAGYFTFVRGGGSSNSSSEAFNPAVLNSGTTATVGALGTMNATMHYAFQNSENFMHIPYLERIAYRDRNKYALSPTGDATDVGTYSPLFTKSEYGSAWFKPYATFESVDLKNGPKVSNITYGSLVGFDTELESIKGGWDRTFTGYIGYNGASQRYSGVDSYQNGGLIGGTMTLYKGNFFNATTLSVGASVASNSTMYGHEDYAMLLSGIGNKTGYNFEFKEGKVILQPSMLMSYTFVNTFDYRNAAGVKIENDPLHAIQLAPGVKVIGNLKGGWQPYVGVSMVWNLLGKSDATANGVRLPQMSVKPYVQYGVGVQKRFKDHFMGFGQAMIQNGGRNGISLTAGFRWAIGHDNCKYEKTQRQPEVKQNLTMKQTKTSNNEILKHAQNDGGKYIGHSELDSESINANNKTSALGVGGMMPRAAEHKRILKQMTPEQKMVYGGRHSTSRTVMSGALKQL